MGRTRVWTKCCRLAALSAWAGLSASAGAMAAEATRCETLNDGVEYRAFLPDQNRYLYIAVKALPGYYPSIFVIIDKNYLKAGGGAQDPVNRWWLDRSRPLRFSTDTVKVTWTKSSGTFSWLSDPDLGVVSQPLRGLGRSDSGYVGTGSTDTNSYAFQTRLEMPGFKEDSFDVILPAVSFDGATVAAPTVHFVKDDKGAHAKC